MNLQIDSNGILNGVSVVDTLNGLSNYHYLECNNNSSSELKQYRGSLKALDGSIVCHSLGFTPEVDVSNEEEMMSIVKPFLEGDVKAFLSYESTLLRVYFHLSDEDVGGWYISTFRKIDAFKSKWGGSKSFGQLFEECLNIPSSEEQNVLSRKPLQEWCEKNLNRSTQYCYIIRTYNENRIVCQGYDKPSLFLIGTYERDVLDIDMTKCDIPSLNIATVEDLQERMKEVDYSKSQGIILINEKGECVKVMKQEYVEAFKLRGNQPNILLRYIELQQQGDGERVERFFNMYPEHKDTIITFTEVIEDICNFIFRKYRNRFIRKQVAIVPPDLYYIIRELHDGYLKDRTQIVTPERVISYVHSLEPLKLLGLFNSYNKRKNEFGNGNKLSKEFMDKVKAMIM
jgi:hypothetical protein